VGLEPYGLAYILISYVMLCYEIEEYAAN